MENEKYKVTSIQRCRLNNKKVKLVEVFEKFDTYNLFAGKFSVPASVANKNILSYLENNCSL